MKASELTIDVASNDLANINTTGHKTHRAEFQDMLYIDKTTTFQAIGDNNVPPVPIQIGLGVKTAAIYRIPNQGALENTNRELDVAINGIGYFIIEMANGERKYTRNGSFSLNENGLLVNSAGYAVSPGLTIPEEALSVHITSNGEVAIKVENQPQLTVIGQLNMARFINDSGLTENGDSLLSESNTSGIPIEGTPGAEGMGMLVQKNLETSAVDPVAAVTHLIKSQRSYEMASQAFKTCTEILKSLLAVIQNA